MPSPITGDVLPLAIGTVCAGLGLWMVWRAARARARGRLLQDLPTSPAAAVFVGWLEAAGTVRCATPRLSPLNRTPCVIARLVISESFRRTETERTRDASGRTQTRTKVVTGWEQVSSVGERCAFELEDESGRVRVDPDQARAQLETFSEHSVVSTDPDYARFTDRGPVRGSTGRRRLHESGIAVGSRIHLVGRGRPTEGGNGVEIGFSERSDVWQGIVVGDAQAVERLAASGSRSGLILAWILLSVACAFLFGTFGLNAGLSGVRGWPAGLRWAASGALVTACAVGVLWFVFTYNELVDLGARARRAVARIDVELSRRATLIPRLASVVGEFARHEREVSEKLAELRTQGEATLEGHAGVDPIRVGGRAAWLLERYPELKSDEVFAGLHDELIRTEDRIGYARRYLSEITARWRTRREQFPTNLLFAWTAGRMVDERTAQAFERELRA